MKVIKVRNVMDALHKGLELIATHGVLLESRVGLTLEIPCPVATTYTHPWERVLISKVRDANPFFHLMESIWILAGRSDVKFLTEFNSRMVDYSDDGEEFNAPYGYRLRNSFDEGNCDQDQLQSVIDILKSDPNSRQAVCQIWDSRDLTKTTKDKACNMSIVFRIRDGKLCMIVYNRSNDMIWGAYGANVVQFSMIQEYVAAHLNLPMGEYTQVTNSYHVYTTGPGGELYTKLYNHYKSFANIYDTDLHCNVRMKNFDIKNIDYDIGDLFRIYDTHGIEAVSTLDDHNWESDYFKCLIGPMLRTYHSYKQFGPEEAIVIADDICADDWRMAATQWLETRIENRKAKEQA